MIEQKNPDGTVTIHWPHGTFTIDPKKETYLNHQTGETKTVINLSRRTILSDALPPSNPGEVLE